MRKLNNFIENYDDYWFLPNIFTAAPLRMSESGKQTGPTFLLNVMGVFSDSTAISFINVFLSYKLCRAIELTGI